MKRISAALAFAVFAVACADPAGPVTRTLETTAPLLAVTSEVITHVPGNSPNPPVGPWGTVQLCKNSDVGGSFVFTLSENGTASIIGTNPRTIVIPTGGGTVCTDIYLSVVDNVDGTTPRAEEVTITETANAAAPIAGIDIIRYLQSSTTYTQNPHLNDTPNPWTAGTLTAVVKINNDMARKVTFINRAPASTGDEGCTPGYWKQEHHFDSWPGAYTQNTLINTALSTTIFPATMTLLQALEANGGGINALARHAAAALLNAASTGVDYPMSVAQVQTTVDGPGSIEARKNIFEGNNELGCPLN